MEPVPALAGIGIISKRISGLEHLVRKAITSAVPHHQRSRQIWDRSELSGGAATDAGAAYARTDGWGTATYLDTAHSARADDWPAGPAADLRGASGLVADDRDTKALRRHKQLKEKGLGVSLAGLSQEILERDRRDSSRAVAPLKPADGAVVIDSTGLAVESVVDRILAVARRPLSASLCYPVSAVRRAVGASSSRAGSPGLHQQLSVGGKPAGIRADCGPQVSD